MTSTTIATVSEIDLWAVHPGGRTILDAVQGALELEAEAMADSREVLRRFGNMSSATVLFVLFQLNYSYGWITPQTVDLFDRGNMVTR